MSNVKAQLARLQRLESRAALENSPVRWFQWTDGTQWGVGAQETPDGWRFVYRNEAKA